MSIATDKQAAVWRTMPGWGIVADLTPPELIATRQLRLLRKFIAAGLTLLVILCGVGYGLAWAQHKDAASALETERNRGTALQAQVSKYGHITKMQATITDLNAKVAQLMAGDVDFQAFLAKVRSNLPATMTIRNETLTLAPGGAAGAASSTTLDTSGNPRIGAVTIAGRSTSMTDVATYVQKLGAIEGIVDVVPTSNMVEGGGYAYTINLGVTSTLLTHKFDLSAKGTK